MFFVTRREASLQETFLYSSEGQHPFASSSSLPNPRLIRRPLTNRYLSVMSSTLLAVIVKSQSGNVWATTRSLNSSLVLRTFNPHQALHQHLLRLQPQQTLTATNLRCFRVTAHKFRIWVMSQHSPLASALLAQLASSLTTLLLLIQLSKQSFLHQQVVQINFNKHPVCQVFVKN